MTPDNSAIHGLFAPGQPHQSHRTEGGAGGPHVGIDARPCAPRRVPQDAGKPYERDGRGVVR